MTSFKMTQQAYLILLTLVQERQHGYGVIKQVAEISGGEVRLAAGTLYGNLDRLLAAAFVVADGEEIVDGRLRRYYRATDLGAQAAQTETENLARLAARAQRVLDRPRALGRPALGGA